MKDTLEKEVFAVLEDIEEEDAQRLTRGQAALLSLLSFGSYPWHRLAWVQDVRGGVLEGQQ